ncbi:MAG TPA: c-type cytochrome [Terriglobia bacterium]|nr:c-type cytochrome [Terriglobia bacterium]
MNPVRTPRICSGNSIWWRVGSFLFFLCLLSSTHQSFQPQRRQASQSYDPKDVEAGSRRFVEHCAVCHGVDGRGSARGPSLMRGLVVNRGSDDEVAGVIRLGVPNSAMPPFALDESEIRQLVAFIRSLRTRAAQLVVAGDRSLGEGIFFGKGRCSNCHMIRGKGGLVGPDLSNVGGDRTLTEIRQSILSPGLSEGTKYKAVTVVTIQGEKIAGTLLNRDNFSLQMMDAQGNLHFFSSAELREVALEVKSAMPANYGKLLSEAELQNLLAFLGRQTVAE